MTDPADALSEATRLSILQGRFEALHLGARQVEPHHLFLGLLKTMDPAALAEAGLDPADCHRLIADLGSTPEPAPLSPGDIDYAEGCYSRIAMAIEAAEGGMVQPEHLLRAMRDNEMTR